MVFGRGAIGGGSNAAIAVLSAATGTFATLLSIVGPAIPVMQAEFNTDHIGANWIMTAYLLSAAVFTPVMGRLGDAHGKKQILIVVLLTLAAGSIVSALAQDLSTMLMGRAIQGVGGGAFPLAFGFLRDHLEGRRLNHAIGVVAGFGAACVGLGAVLSGIIVAAVGFRWIFWGPAITLLIAAAVVVMLPRSRTTKAPINPLSVVLFAVGLASFLLVVNQGAIWGITSSLTLFVAGLALVGLLAWGIVDWRMAGPLIDLRMMRGNVMMTTSLSAGLLGVALYGLQTFIPQFVQTGTDAEYGLGLTVLQSGLTMLPMAAGMFLTGFTSARFLDWFGARTLLIAAPALAAIGVVFLIPSPVALWQVLVASGLAGLGIGLTFSVMPAVVVSAVKSSQSGLASGINANLRTVGGAVGTAVIAAIVVPSVGNAWPLAIDYQLGFLFIAISAMLSACVGFFTRVKA